MLRPKGQRKLRLHKKKNASEDVIPKCPICFEVIPEGTGAVLVCNHTFCIACFAQHARQSHLCPMCRSEFSPALKQKEKQREMLPREVAERIVDREVGAWILPYVLQEGESNRTRALREWVSACAMNVAGAVTNWYEADT